MMGPPGSRKDYGSETDSNDFAGTGAGGKLELSDLFALWSADQERIIQNERPFFAVRTIR